MGAQNVPTDPRSKAKWLAGLTDADGPGNVRRRDWLIETCRNAGIWLHPEGTLEDVLGITDKKGDKVRAAADTAGLIDNSARWCVFTIDLSKDLEALLNLAVERIASSILSAQRLNPDRQFDSPLGAGVGAERLVSVTPVAERRHRITVQRPKQFLGWWIEIDRDTPPSAFVLRPPAQTESNDEPQMQGTPVP
jgi:hypothetical protein